MTEHKETGEDRLIEGRREKNARVLEGGGYPHRYQRTHLAAELHERYADLGPEEETGDRVAVAGRLMLQRSFGRAPVRHSPGRLGQHPAVRRQLGGARRLPSSSPSSTWATGWVPRA